MKVSLLKLLRRKKQPDGHPKSNHQVVGFSICILVSFAFWFMNMLSKKYTESLVFYIQYQHLTQSENKVTTTDTMRIKITTSGYRLTGYKFGFLDKLIKIDATQFRHKGNQLYYTLANHLHAEKIEEQLGEEMKVLDISPDTLFISPVQPQIPDKS
jgi:hypothetical protein